MAHWNFWDQLMYCPISDEVYNKCNQKTALLRVWNFSYFVQTLEEEILENMKYNKDVFNTESNENIDFWKHII